MQTKTFTSRQEWLSARRGKITGSRLADIVTLRGNGKKIGFYELIAERIAIPDTEDPLERGQRLEPEALEEFAKQTGKKINTDLVLWHRDDNESIAVSPDAYGKGFAVETKCLSSARHMEAYLTQKLPNEYRMQALQYFIVNDALKTLYFVFYDPRIPVLPFFYLTLTRKDLADDIATYHEYQTATLAEVDKIVNELTKF